MRARRDGLGLEEVVKDVEGECLLACIVLREPERDVEQSVEFVVVCGLGVLQRGAFCGLLSNQTL